MSASASTDTEPLIENGVLRGRRGQLFLVGGAHDVLAYATGQRDVPVASIANFRANIEARAMQCGLGNAAYLHVIFPDKHTVLDADFPLPTSSLGELYLRHVGPWEAQTFWPLRLLRALPDCPFMRLDTHMTDASTAHLAGEIARRLLGLAEPPDLGAVLASITRTVESAGDLGVKMTTNETEPALRFGKDWNTATYSNQFKAGNNGVVDLYFNRHARCPGRLLFFGDSFGRNTAFALSYFFAQVVFLRTPFFHTEMFRGIAPDYVVTGNVERYLSCVMADAMAPPFLLYPHLNGIDYAPTKSFARAFAAVLSYGRPLYESFLAELGAGAPTA